MAIDVIAEDEIRQLELADPKLACDEVRKLVAAHPTDERLAAFLREIVRRFKDRAHTKGKVAHSLPPALAEVTELMSAGELEKAELLLRQHLKTTRNDPTAMHLMAEIAARCGLREDSERILRYSAHLHGHSAEAMADLGRTLHRIGSVRDLPEYVGESLAAFDRAIEIDPFHEGVLSYRASMLVHERGLDAGRRAFEQLVSAHPCVSEHWMNYGFVLKTIGDFGSAVAAYRTATALDSANGGAWWGLANLKLGKFFKADIDEMNAAFGGDQLNEIGRVEIHFALAKALDDARDYTRAARHLKDGNQLRAKLHPPNSDGVTADVDFVTRFFTKEYFDQRQGWGDPRSDPIFIVGMPRAGSTLLEQILSSHSAIEGTEELFILLKIGSEMTRDHAGKRPDQIMLEIGRDEVTHLGGRYLELAQRFRRTTRPFFTDKNPSNWHYLGLIHSVLPNAKIIDVRRNPMDCCFGNYRQHFQSGANFSYGLRDLGRYYSDYVRMMRHFDVVLPGRIHRVIYDDLVDDLEGQVRRLLDYLELPFDENCLRYYETDRPVHTPSSEQVRQPINRSGFERWRPYETWLGELKDSLGDLIANWRQ